MKFVLLLFFTVGIFATACAEGYLKYIRKIFQVVPGTELFAGNRYGTVRVIQSDCDSLIAEVRVSISAADTALEEIVPRWLNLESEAWDGTVRLETIVDSSFKKVDDLRVDMTLYVPEYVAVNIENRYGDICIPCFNARLPLRLSCIYGDIRVDTLHSFADAGVSLNVAYGHLKIGRCGNASIKSAYSDVETAEAGNLDIKSEKSDVLVHLADTVVIQGNSTVLEVRQCKLLNNRLQK